MDEWWRNAMETEIDAQEQNQTLTIKDILLENVLSDANGFSKLKHNSSGSTERYKA